ncbi:MAG TPA: hypothetical protein VIH90_05870 [Candidatus Saccharimonadales bacterium]
MPRTAKQSKVAVATTGLIDRSNPDHIARLNDEVHKFTEASQYFVAETNETERALCAQLMLIDTVLLTGTLVAVANQDLFNALTTPVSTLILLALVFLLISMGFGIKYYFTIIGYDKKWAIAKHRAMREFLDNSIQTWGELRKKTNDHQTDIPEELDTTFLRMQIIFIAGAALAYLIALFGLLFNVSNIISHL